MRVWKITICLITCFLPFWAWQVFCFDNQIIHPRLTEAAISVYEREIHKDLSSEEEQWIVQGAIAEDTDPRYLNHFYNPQTGQGLRDGPWQGKSAKEWAQEQDSVSGDYSVGTIFDNYKKENYKRAYQGIGHILHLVQDMAVPAHTRNDSHPDGDPFEVWLKRNSYLDEELAELITIKSIDCTFDDLANYTNKYFFSEDTVSINEEKYNIIDSYLECEDNDNNNFLCVKRIISPFGVYYKIDDEVIHKNYWNLLYPKVVGYSAGAIDYFIKEFERIDKKRVDEELSFFQSIKTKIDDNYNNFKYAFGDTVLASRFGIEKTIDNIKELSREVIKTKEKIVKESQEVANDIYGEVLSVTEEINKEQESEQMISAQNADRPATPQDVSRSPKHSVASLPAEQKSKSKSSDVVVENVIDGDTIMLSTGERVRYIGIDTPELNKKGSDDDECLAWVARTRNIDLLGKGEVKLIKDEQVDKDKYGRLLRYVYAGDVFVNRVLAEEGLAKVFFCQPDWENCPVVSDSKEKEDIIRAGEEAQKTQKGIYSQACKEEKIVDTEKEQSADNENIDYLKIERQKITSFPSSATQEDVTVTEEAISDPFKVEPQVINFQAWDLFSSSTNYTASTSVGVNIKLSNEGKVQRYCVSTSALCVDGKDWSGEKISRYDLGPEEGNKNLYLYLDTEKGIDEYASTSIIFDVSVPVSSFNYLDPYYLQNNFVVSWQGVDEVSGVASYDVEYKTNNVWQNLASNTASTSIVFDKNVDKGSSIYFRLRAIDLAGNAEEWPFATSSFVHTKLGNKGVLISEIKISGNSTTDEFVELYNPTDIAINLNSYKLSRKTSSGNEYNLLSSFDDILILPNSYYLITHPSGYALNVRADAVYSTSQSIAANNTVILYDGEGMVLDKVGMGTASEYENEATDNPESGDSLERKSVSSSTAEFMYSGEHKFLGNKYDSDNNRNDFVIQHNPNPQNKYSSPEPRGEYANYLMYFWHFDECIGGNISDYIREENLVQNAEWTVGKWDCGLKQAYEDKYKIVKELSSSISSEVFSFSYYWRNQPVDGSEGRGHIYFKGDLGQILAGIAPSIVSVKIYYKNTEIPLGLNMPSDNEWHHIALVYNYNNISFYIDGELSGSLAGDYSLGEEISSIEIAGENYPVERDELAIWSSALGSEEVAEIASSAVSLRPYAQRDQQEKAVKLYNWAFNEGSGTSSVDSIGSEALVLTNSSWTQNGKASSCLRQSWQAEYAISHDFLDEINSQDISLGFWYRNISYPNEGRGRIILRDGDGLNIFGIKFTPISPKVYFNNVEFSPGNIITNDNEWHYIVLVYNSYDLALRLYVDGEEKYNLAHTWHRTPITSMEIVGENWEYDLDELSIWEGVLNTEDVVELSQSF